MQTSTEIVWKSFNKELLGFIKSRVKDRDTANDILQNVFLKIHLKISTLQNTESLKSWIYQITRNTINDHYRTSKPYSELSDDFISENEPDTYNESFSSCISPFINQLPEKYKEALDETELKGVSQKEFAEKMNISHSGMKSRVQRGREMLVDTFKACCKITPDKYGNIIDYEKKDNCGCSNASKY